MKGFQGLNYVLNHIEVRKREGGVAIKWQQQ